MKKTLLDWCVSGAPAGLPESGGTFSPSPVTVATVIDQPDLEPATVPAPARTWILTNGAAAAAAAAME